MTKNRKKSDVEKLPRMLNPSLFLEGCILKDSKLFFGSWLLFIAFAVKMIPHCFHNVHFRALGRPIHE